MADLRSIRHFPWICGESSCISTLAMADRQRRHSRSAVANPCIHMLRVSVPNLAEPITVQKKLTLMQVASLAHQTEQIRSSLPGAVSGKGNAVASRKSVPPVLFKPDLTSMTQLLTLF